MDLSLKIKVDFNEASRQFKELADSSEHAQEKIEKFSKRLASDHADKFIAKQQMMGAAITATKGDLAAMEAQKAAYGREIERLIKNGIKPEDDAVQKLKKEYDGLSDEISKNIEKQKALDAAAKVATGALVALGAAVGVAAGIALKAAADMEDQIASLVPMMGGSQKAAEDLFKTIRQEAVTTPFEISNITDSVRSLMPAFQGSAESAVKAFRMIGDTAQGNSQKLVSITRAYTNAMLSNKVSMKELNTIAGAGVPIFTEMAESMGITVEQLREMSSDGKLTADDLTGAFQKMTSEGGLFYNGMESASDTFNMRVLGLKENLGILASEIGTRLLPAAKGLVGGVSDAVAGFIKWAQEGDNLDRLLNAISIAVTAAAAGFATFILVSKGHAMITALTVAIKGLMTASTGPAGIAALAIGALAAGIGILTSAGKNQYNQAIKTAEGHAKNKEAADSLLSSFDGLTKVKDLDKRITDELIKLYPHLSDVMSDAEMTVNELRTQLEEQFNDESIRDAKRVIEAFVRENAVGLSMLQRDFGIFSLDYIINEKLGSSGKRDALKMVDDVNAILSRIGKDVDLSKNLDDLLRGNNLFKTSLERQMSDLNEIMAAERAEASKTLTQRLNEVKENELQKMNNLANQVKSFLNSRADLERTAGEERITSIKAEYDRIIQSDKLAGEELIAALQAKNELIKEIEDKMLEDEKKNAEEKKDIEKETLRSRVSLFKEAINEIDITEKQAQADRIASVQEFFMARANAEHDELYARLEFMREQAAMLLENEKLEADERLAVEEALQSAINKLHDETAKREREQLEENAKLERSLLESRMNALTGFFGGMINLLGVWEKDNIAAFYASRALSASEAGINSYLAFTKTLADGPPYPWNIPAAAGVLASGLAQQAKIWSSKPSAETGGRFIVPDMAGGVDNVGLRVNPGEVIDVTPRGNDAVQMTQHIFMLNDQVVFDTVNRGIKSGDIHVYYPEVNL